jgi:hypothetical protein
MKIPTHKVEDEIDTYRKGGSDDVTSLYPEVLHYLTDLHQCTYDDILLLDWDCVEICIYIKGRWRGYVSDVERVLSSKYWRKWDINVDEAIARMKKYAGKNPIK